MSKPAVWRVEHAVPLAGRVHSLDIKLIAGRVLVSADHDDDDDDGDADGVFKGGPAVGSRGFRGFLLNFQFLTSIFGAFLVQLLWEDDDLARE